MKIKNVCILGGTGFVGQQLVASLKAKGYQPRVLTRHVHRHRPLWLAGAELLETDIFDEWQLRERFAGMDAVINLVGILNERGHDGSGFQHAHVDLPRTVAAACKRQGIQRLLHMSALRAGDPHASSHYLRTKGEGEEVAHSADGLVVTSFRPSVIFGPKDSFLNKFATLLRLFPVLPLACPTARFAPVYVGDVVKAFVTALEDPASHGQRYNLCGPDSYSLRQLVEYTARLIGVRPRIIPLDDRWSQRQAKLFERIPGKPLSWDNYLSLQLDSVCPFGSEFPFGIQPTPVDAIAPRYLKSQGYLDRYTDFRARAGRSA